MSKVKENDAVKVHYTGTLANGEIFDTSIGREALAFQMGQGMMIPGFEKGVLGMELNEMKIVVIPATEAYGEVREDLIHEVSKSQLPQELVPEVGMPLVSQMPNGQQIQLTITEVKKDTIVVDANHPLAGKELTFEIQVVEIN